MGSRSDAAQRVIMEFTAPFRKAAAGEEEGRQISVARLFRDARAGETGKAGSDPPPGAQPDSRAAKSCGAEWRGMLRLAAFCNVVSGKTAREFASRTTNPLPSTTPLLASSIASRL